MSTTADQAARATSSDRWRGGAHYRPHPRHRTDDASRHARSCHEALAPWIAEMQAGKKRYLITALSNANDLRTDDDLLCDVAHALATATEWEGVLLCHELIARGWPADCALARALQAWSCALQDRLMAQLRARRA